ncbi:MAG: hypothetical protein V4662_07315 [Verrucomicrobiota bacterium]
MLKPTEITEYGERHVEKWLAGQGYHCFHNTQRRGTKDLEARGGENNMLIHVLSGLASHSLPSLSQTEHDSVCSRAIMLGFDAWVAEVHVDREGDLVGNISWKQLT